MNFVEHIISAAKPEVRQGTEKETIIFALGVFRFLIQSEDMEVFFGFIRQNFPESYGLFHIEETTANRRMLLESIKAGGISRQQKLMALFYGYLYYWLKGFRIHENINLKKLGDKLQISENLAEQLITFQGIKILSEYKSKKHAIHISITPYEKLCDWIDERLEKIISFQEPEPKKYWRHWIIRCMNIPRIKYILICLRQCLCWMKPSESFLKWVY